MLGDDHLAVKDRTAIRQLIIEWTDEFADSRIDAWLDRWADDAVLMPPGGPRVHGRENLAEFAASFPMGSNYQFEDWNFAGSNDLAIVSNRISLQGDSSDEQLFDQIIVLRQKSDVWKIQSVIFTPTIR